MKEQLIQWMKNRTIVTVKELAAFGNPANILNGTITGCDDIGFVLESRYPNGMKSIFVFPYGAVTVTARAN